MDKLKFKTEKVIDLLDWDTLVMETYGRIYSFQQQEDCQPRRFFHFSVPSEETYDDEMPESIPEALETSEMGVKFAPWLTHDPKKPLPGQKYDYELELWWKRNFYPDFQTLANDLHSKGLIEAGEYTIKIDW